MSHRRRCGACAGTGWMPLSQPLEETAAAVRALENEREIGSSPTTKEIAERLGVPMSTALTQRLRTLEQLTIIYRGPRRGRSLTWSMMPF